MVHEEFGKLVVPTSVKMFKHDPKLALEVACLLLKLTKLDLRKYVGDILPIVLQYSHQNHESRRKEDLEIIKTLIFQSSDPDSITTMFNSIM